MKLIFGVLALLRTLAFAETAQYQAEFLGATATLTVTTSLPGAITVVRTPAITDPELGFIPASVSVTAKPATLTLEYAGRIQSGDLFASGQELYAGLTLTSFEGYFPLAESGGVIYGGPLFLPASAVVDGLRVTALALPSEFEARWELEGNYPTESIHRGDAPKVHFVKK